MRPDPALSFVVPALDEEAALPLLLRDIAGCAVAHEVIVADGGSADATREVARAAGARVVEAPRGRGTQLAAGAAAARAPLLCFLHADVRLGAAARSALEAVAGSGEVGAWAFRLRIAAPGWRFRVVEAGTALRARAGLPYGDQGLVVSRALYDAAGGYPAVPIMEDVALVRALRRFAPVRILPAAVEASARRWRRDGVLRRTVRNWLLLGAFLLGAEPARLARRYTPNRG